ncbi:S-layer protein [Paenibacillus faecis]|uniref:Intimin n=1 Tax=Paenibacillus faecis TaxID=862114 RepID=A0A5D0CKW6_9BACL|nr:invasin domain 3-containing protein [Paenibacillus faecis]TYA10180.1 S-layer protein [Paenibacillus faecis]
MHRLKKIGVLALALVLAIPAFAPRVYAASAAPSGVKAFGAGYLHTLLIVEDGTVWGMGDNSAGALGDGTTTNSFRPVQVMKADGSPLTNAAAVAGGGYFSVALLNDGTVWTWGRGAYGKLGNGASDNQYRAVQVIQSDGSPLTQVHSIASAYDHTLALKDDGSVWGWGSNSSNQLTDYYDISIQRAVRIKASNGSYLTDVKAVGGGDYHSMALKEDGTVWAWGYGGFGALGNGSTADSVYPVQVTDSSGAPLTGITDLKGNRLGGMVLKEDGTVWSWGYNENYNLGNPGVTSSNRAIQVLQTGSVPLTGVSKISGGGRLSMALKSDGTVWWWGMQNRNLQVATKFLSDAREIYAGDNHGLVMKADGTVWGGGWTSKGELGTSYETTYIYYTSPIQVYPARTNISADPPTLLADGTGKTTVTVTLKEGSGYNIGKSEGSVQLNTTLGTLGPVTDHGNGTYTAELTASKTSGTATITGTINGYPLTAPGKVTIKPLGPSLSKSTLTANPLSVPADGASSSTLSLQLIDDNGNALTASGGTVQMSTTAGTLTPVTDHKNGTYTAVLKAPVAVGSAVVTAKLGGQTIAQTATVQFVPGAASASASEISLDASQLQAGKGTATATVRLRDANGNPLTQGGDTVVIQSANGTIGKVNDLGNGTYTAVFKAGTTAGTGKVGATVNGAVLQRTAEVTITADEVSYEISTLTADDSTIVADGGSWTNITLTLKDQYGNFLSNRAGKPTLSTTAGALSAVTDHGNGSYTARLFSSSVTGAATVSARMGLSFKQTVQVAFIPGAASADQSVLSADSSTLAAGTGKTMLTVKLKDTHGNALTTGGDAVTLQTTGGTLGAVADKGDGTYTAALTAPRNAGTVSVSGAVNGVKLRQTVELSVVPGPVSEATSVINVDAGTLPANGTSKATVTVCLKDAYGNPLTASAGKVLLSATAGTLSAVTDRGDGTYSATWTAPTAAGAATVTGSIGGRALASKATVSFVPGSASPAATSVLSGPDAITADGVSSATVTVQARDAYGNPITQGGDRVALETTGGTLSKVTDHGDGTYTATLTSSTQAGKATVSAVLNGTKVSQVAEVTFVAGQASSATSELSVGTAALTADGISSTALTVRLKDAYGNALVKGGDHVAFQTTAGGVSQIADLGNGVYTAVLTAPRTAGSGTVTATVNGAALRETASIAFLPGAASPETSLLIPEFPAITADGTSTSKVTVRLIDVSGNELDRGGDHVVLTTTAGALGAVEDNGDGTYTAVLTAGTVTGLAQLSGTVNGEVFQRSAAVEFVTGAASAAHSVLEADTRELTANGVNSTKVTLRLKDRFGNSLNAGGDRVEIQTSAGTLSSVTDQADGTYTAVLTSGTKAGLAELTGTVNGVALAAGTPIEFRPGGAAAERTALSADRTAVTADGSSKAVVTIQLKDEFGNELGTDGGAIQLKLSTTLGILTDAKYTSSGRYTAELSSAAAGTAVVTGTLGGVPIGSSATVFFEPGRPSPATSTVGADRTTLIADGSDEALITVQLKDASGNTVPDSGAPAVIRIDSTLGTVTSAVYEADGRYKARLISTTAGTATVTASIDDAVVADTVQVELQPGPASAPASELKVNREALPANGTAAALISVKVKDAYGNPTTAPGGVRLETTLGTVTEAAYGTAGEYMAEIRSTEPGIADIRAWINGAEVPGGVRVTFADGIWFTPPSYRLQIGESQRTVVEVTYGDMTADLTSEASFEYNDGLIQIGQAADGYWYITGLQTGTTVIQAVYEGDGGRLTARAPVTVYAVPTRLAFGAAGYEVKEGEQLQLELNATYSDGTSAEVSGEASFHLGVEDIAAVDAAGRLRGLKAGTTRVSATYEGLTATAEIHILPGSVKHDGSEGEGPGRSGSTPSSGVTNPPRTSSRGELNFDLLLDGVAGRTVVLNAEQIRSGVISIETKEGSKEWALLVKPAVLDRLLEQNGGMKLEWQTPLGDLELHLADLRRFKAQPSLDSIRLSLESLGPERESRLLEIAKKMDAELRIEPFLLQLSGLKSDGTLLETDDHPIALIFEPARDIRVPSLHLTAATLDESIESFRYVPARFGAEGAVAFKLPGSGIYTVLENHRSFSDLNGHWARLDVETMANKLIVKGTDDGRFEPEQSVTRAELAAMLVRMLGLVSASETAAFRDISGKWYEAEITAAFRAGLVKGDENGDFRPDAAVSRQEMFVMISRAMETAGFTHLSAERFALYADHATIAGWAAPAVESLTEAGLLKGNPSNLVKPLQTATRAEAAAILARWLQLDI